MIGPKMPQWLLALCAHHFPHVSFAAPAPVASRAGSCAAASNDVNGEFSAAPSSLSLSSSASALASELNDNLSVATTSSVGTSSPSSPYACISCHTLSLRADAAHYARLQHLLETRFDRVRARVRRAAAAAANETTTALQHMAMVTKFSNGTAQQPQQPLYTSSSSSASSSRRPSWLGSAPLSTADGTRSSAADNAAVPVHSLTSSSVSSSNANTSGASLSSSSPPPPSSSPQPQPQLQSQPQSPALHLPFDTVAVDWPQRLSALIRERDLMAVEKGGLYSTVEVMNLLVFGAPRVLRLCHCF